MPFVTRDGVRIHYEVWGNGPTIVVVPGLGSAHVRDLLSEWMNAVSPHRWVAVNPRGHGDSDKPREPAAHQIEQYRDDVLAAMNATETDRAVLCGFSDGGSIGYAFAEAYPERLVGFVDYDGVEGVDMCDPAGRKSRLELADTVRRLGWKEVIQEVIRSQVAEDSPVFQCFEAAETEMVLLELEEWTKWHGAFSILGRLKVPSLVLLNSSRTPDEIERIHATAPANVDVRVVPGTNHMKLCTEPNHSAALLRSFLSRVEAEGTAVPRSTRSLGKC